MESKFVVFRLGNERYGLPIDQVERIVPAVQPTKLPRAPKALLGVFEIRGSTIPVMDARIRFNLPESADCRNFVIVFTPQGRCALRVDDVVGIIELTEKDVDQHPSLSGSEDDPFVAGIGKQNDQLTVLLDPQHLVPQNLLSSKALQEQGSSSSGGKRGGGSKKTADAPELASVA